MIVLNIFHPGRYLPKTDKTYLDENGQEVESDRAGWEDKRPFLQTLFDPFNIGGLVRTYRKKKRAAKAKEVNGGVPVEKV